MADSQSNKRPHLEHPAQPLKFFVRHPHAFPVLALLWTAVSIVAAFVTGSSHGWSHGAQVALGSWVLGQIVLLLLAKPAEFGRSRRRDLVAAAVAYLAWLAAVWALGERRGSLEFHAISAQVIPVLTLALVFQARAFEVRRSSDLIGASYIVLTFTFVVFGEAVALGSVFTGKPSHGAFVVGAIAAQFAALTVVALGIGGTNPVPRAQSGQP